MCDRRARGALEEALKLAKGTDSNYLPGWCGPATVGIARAKTKIGLANLVYNIKRLLFLRRIAAA
jgi:hypothetical protein